MTPAALCHQERTAWLLNDTAPPTFPDRLREGAARYTDHRDALSGLRVRAHCATGDTVQVDVARWPAVLEPWLDDATRRRALPPRWTPPCARAQAPEAGLRIVGVAQGETIRRAGSGAAPVLRLEARGGQQDLIWLVDGRQVARVPSGKAFHHAFEDPGRHAITVMDDSGRYDRVDINVH